MASPFKTTVSVASGTIDLTTPQAVKTELNITDHSLDPWLSSQITRESRAAATYCNREFGKETLIDRFRLDDESIPSIEVLVLSRTPLVSITSIVEDGTTLTASQYEFEALTGFVWRLESDVRQCWAMASIVVTFVAGYELLTTLPHDIELAVIEMMKQAYFAKQRDPLVKSVSVDGIGSRDYWVGSVGDNAAIPPKAEALLDPYRHRNV